MEEIKKDTTPITEAEQKKALSLKEENKKKIEWHLKLIKELRNENRRYDKKQESRQAHLGNHLFKQAILHYYIFEKKLNEVNLKELPENSFFKVVLNELKNNDYFKRLKYTEAEFDLYIENLQEYIDGNKQAPSAEHVKENIQREPPKYAPEQTAQIDDDFLANLKINNPKEYHF